MKKTLLIGVLMLTAAISGQAQEKKNQNQPMKLVPIETNNITPEQEIKNCQSQIEAIDKKEAWIRSNPEELKTANETNWFENADKTREDLRKRIAELKK